MTKKVELPDFEDMMNLATKIGDAKKRLLVLETNLENLLAIITKRVTEKKDYWINNKPPSNVHIKDTYHILGCDEETRKALQTLRNEIAQAKGDMESDKLLFDVYKEMINVWRTQSANERGSYL
jgi:hypothetical protein